MSLITLFRHLLQPAVTNEAVRMEIYRLGSRRRGEPLAGAIQELREPSLKPDRSRLLRAVVEQLTRKNALAGAFVAGRGR